MNDSDAPPIILRHLEPLKTENDVFKSIYDWTLEEKDLEKARRELGESEEIKKACLQELKNKLSNDANVKYRQDDAYLLRFLRVRKYDVPKAYKNIKLLYEMRKKNPENFMISPKTLSLQELNWVTCLPYADEDGRILALLNFKRWDPYENSYEEMLQTVMNEIDLLAMNPKCQINGVVILYDLSGITFKHVTELLWSGRMTKCATFLVSACPMRIKRVICFNTNRFVPYLFNILKPFLSRKIAERIFLIGSDINELHQHVKPALLPKRLEGSLEEEECDASQFVLNNLPYIRYERSFSVL